MTTSREKIGLALGVAGVLLFGGTLPATRLAAAALDPLFLSAACAAIAGCAGLLLLLLVLRRSCGRSAKANSIFMVHRFFRGVKPSGLVLLPTGRT